MNPKTPTAIRRLTGNPQHRPMPANEPQTPPVPVDISPPSWLCAPARREWRKLAPAIARIGLLTEAGLGTFAAYCDALGRAQIAAKVLNREGHTVQEMALDREGKMVRLSVKTRPEVVQHRQYLELAKRCASELGLTPVSSSRVSVPGVRAPDDFEREYGG